MLQRQGSAPCLHGLLGVLRRRLRGRRSWQGRVGCYRRSLEEGCVRRLCFALCSAASASFRTHPCWPLLRPAICRRCPRASANKPWACWCSSDAPNEHQPPVPIAHLGPRLCALICEPRDVPGVLSGVIGTKWPRGWVNWLFVRTNRNLLPAPPSRGMRVYASLPWLGIVLSRTDRRNKTSWPQW